jgi:F0F1-type ATP synthase assembly protein I
LKPGRKAVPQGLPDPKQLGAYFVLAQVGLEMVAPLVLGLLLDRYLGWTPWATITGAMLGLIGGVIHLVVLQGRPKGPGKRQSRDGP